MKYSFARAFATASFICVTVSVPPGFPQAATMPVQDEGMPAQGENLAKTWPKSQGSMTPYQVQEEAIQKGLAEDAAQAKKAANSFPSENLNNNFPSSKYNAGGLSTTGSKMRGMASMAGRMLAKTAQVTLPTAGMVLLGTAMNRGAMNMYNGGGYHNGYNRGMMPGSYGYGANPMQNAASAANYNNMAGANYGYAPAYNNYNYTGH